MTKEEKTKAVIELIAEGNSERSACAQVGINRATFKSTALAMGSAGHYARALEGLAQSQVELLEQCIDDMRSGVIDAQMARVEIDARKWFASKFLPKQYGDKSQIDHSSSDGTMSPPTRIEIVAPGSKSVE